MHAREFLSTIQSKQHSKSYLLNSPVFLLIGEDNYFKNKILQTIKNILENDIDEPLKFSLLNTPEDSIVEILNTVNLTLKKHFIVLKDLEKSKLCQFDKLKEYIKNPQNFSILVIICDEINKNHWLFSDELCKMRKIIIIECNPLKEYQVIEWVIQEVYRAKKKIEPTTARFLVSLVGTNLNILENSLEKIILFIGNKNVITKQDIELIVVEEKDNEVFHILNAIREKNNSALLQHLLKNSSKAEDASSIIGLIYWGLKNMYQAIVLLDNGFSKTDVIKKLSIHPYQQEKFFYYLSGFSQEKIRNMLFNLRDVDLLFKTTNFKNNTLFEILTLKLINC